MEAEIREGSDVHIHFMVSVFVSMKEVVFHPSFIIWDIQKDTFKEFDDIFIQGVTLPLLHLKAVFLDTAHKLN